ncbi:MAG: homoserine O-acetyltransferase [Anaerolineae bacterium]|nr:homoserine O-acetyltransferase [Anaerolineae bacterium]
MSIDNDVPIADDSRPDGAHSVGLVETRTWTFDEPLELDCGRTLTPVSQAYEIYGVLNDRRDNAVLIFHALTGDAHVAGYHTLDDRKPGWWDLMVGPGKPFDTDRYMIICANVIGGCKGTTGPASIDPQTDKPYGLDFPVVTIGDMVRAQKRLVDHLGIERLLAVVGGSIGGMLALDWAVRYPDATASVLAIATSARLNAQGIAFNEVGRQAIMADPRWQRGDYYGKESPVAGLAIARMIGHITYLSDEQMRAKFGRRLQTRESFGYDFETEFQVESYLKYQGDAFVRRFDANSYLYITKAIDYFDLANGHHSLVNALEAIRSEFLVVSFSSDWLFPTSASKEIVRALQANGVPTTFLEIPNSYGHDAFLLPSEDLSAMLRDFLGNMYNKVQEPAVIWGITQGKKFE